MLIQLKTREGTVLYEQEQSALFPDYRSVLVEAIATGVDLDNLYIRGRKLDNLVFKGVKIKGLTFSNCIVVNARFEDCELEAFHISYCDCSRLKIKNSKLEGHWSNSIFNGSSLRGMVSNLLYIEYCKMADTHFKDCVFTHISFHSVDLIKAWFENSDFEIGYFLHKENTADWYTDMTLLHCKLGEVHFTSIQDLSKLFVWHTNLRDAFHDWSAPPEIVKVESNNSTVVYCADQDVLWWKQEDWFYEKHLIWRSTLQDFIDEVANEYPKTEILQTAMGVYIDDELELVSDYLKKVKAFHQRMGQK
ncbi:MAG: hypothetical protein COA80_19975 [Leeuwenhoekiella sp.]|nr:MAG: hypothetical protein COA80_19975 [Leeuwenhoekiella sp.]